MYQSTKVIDGFSTCFRQWRAESHCNQLHGYALKFKLIFEADTLDSRNWVQDFGFTKQEIEFSSGYRPGTVKDWFNYMFDHTTLVSNDDPKLSWFQDMNNELIIDLRILPHVGCEAFAKYVFDFIETNLKLYKGRVRLKSVECIENEKNSAIFEK